MCFVFVKFRCLLFLFVVTWTTRNTGPGNETRVFLSSFVEMLENYRSCGTPFRKADLLNNSDGSSIPNNIEYVWNVVALACERKGSATPSEKQRRGKGGDESREEALTQT